MKRAEARAPFALRLRRRALIPALLLALLVLSQSASGQQSLTNGLWAYYSFDDGRATDNYGNGGRSGVSYGGIQAVPGRFGQGLEFNGTNTYVALGNHPRFINVTLSAWVKFRTNSTAGEKIVDHWAGYEPMSLSLSGTNGLRFTASYHDMLPDGSMVYQETHATDPSARVPGQFYHVAMTYDGVRLRLYVDGQKVTEAVTDTSSPYGGTQPATPAVRIGAQQSGQFQFRGVIDEVRIYDRALSSNEISQVGVLLGLPSIVQQPAGTNLLRGMTLSLSVVVEGTGPHYQWFWRNARSKCHQRHLADSKRGGDELRFLSRDADQLRRDND